nr:unnamed protein product [Callosobruchus chinensis]
MIYNYVNRSVGLVRIFMPYSNFPIQHRSILGGYRMLEATFIQGDETPVKIVIAQTKRYSSFQSDIIIHLEMLLN